MFIYKELAGILLNLIGKTIQNLLFLILKPLNDMAII